MCLPGHPLIIKQTDIVFNGINPFSIAAPGLNQIGEVVETEIEIYKDNCNIIEAMKTQPESIGFIANATTNPSGMGSNFATDSSDLKVGFEILLPLWVKAEGFTLRDTLEWNFEDEFGEDTDIISYLRLTLDAE